MRYLLSEKVIEVWVDTDLDPTTSRAFKALRRDADAALDEAVEKVRNDPRIAHDNITLGVSEE